MFIEGLVLRDGWKGIDISKVVYEPEIEVFLGGPDDPNRRSLGTAHLFTQDDGIHAEFTLSEMDNAAFADNSYFGVALANPREDGTQDLVYLGLTDSNQDPEIKPANGS